MNIKAKVLNIDMIKKYYGQNEELAEYLEKIDKSVQNAINADMNLSLIAYLFSNKNLQNGVICDEVIGYPPLPVKHLVHVNVITTEIVKHIRSIINERIDLYLQYRNQKNIYAPTSLYMNNNS